ncbi:uncharacterized protein PRCAT00005109001 [Priceomyces carsonii]|uniref:uncharacterized protein n=1 Tax=Priceomyces carsonii TaxID=28549 RepID=UPI002EDBA2BB|nr:unnamed protein product [Priceomyces carsonii]
MAEDFEAQTPRKSTDLSRILKLKFGIEKTDYSVSIYIGEFFGTFFFFLSAFLIASSANNILHVGGENARLLVIAIGFGFSLFVAASCFGFLSGGHYNPGVSCGLFLTGQISLLRFFLESVTQIISGMCAAGAASAMIAGPITFANIKQPDVSVTRGLFLEATGICLLNLAVFMTNEPFKIGFSLFLGHLFCVDTTGAGINPARAFGPCVAARSFPGYHWIYWIGPIIGAIVSAAIYDITEIAAVKTDPNYKKDIKSE